MRIQLIPPNEDLRLHDLYSYDILDSEEEEDFNNLLEVATHICKCPIAAITFIDEDRQWIKSGKNINFKTTKREDGICAHTILGKNVMIVNDTSLDERFVKNPFVDCENGIRFYAGAPIVSGNGYNLGTVCVIDNQPRELDPEQIKILSILSGQVSKPDILCLAKAITGGYAPMGACITTSKIANKVMKNGFQFYSTYGWHPLAVEAATATVRYWMKNKDQIFRNVTALSQDFADRISQMKFKKGASLRILGLAIGIDVNNPDYANRIQQNALKKGLLFTTQQKTLTLFPPLTMKRSIAEEGLKILESCL